MRAGLLIYLLLRLTNILARVSFCWAAKAAMPVALRLATPLGGMMVELLWKRIPVPRRIG
jgi:hypothetical protein